MKKVLTGLLLLVTTGCFGQTFPVQNLNVLGQLQFNGSPGAAGTVPQSNGSGPPTWVAPSTLFPTLPLSVFNGGTGATTATGATTNLQYLQGGTGSVARSLTSKFQEPGVSVADFGALCDGATNDSAAFNAANAALSTSGGGTIWVPSATSGCVLNSTVTLGANVTLQGYGKNASHLLSGTVNLNPMIQLNGLNSAVKDLDIRAGNAGLNTGGTTIAMSVSQNQQVYNTWIDSPCIGIDINGNTSTVDLVTVNNVSGVNCGGFRVGLLTVHALTADARLTRSTLGGNSTTAGFGLLVLDAGGLWSTFNDFIFALNGTKIIPGANQEVDFAFFEDTAMADTTSGPGIVIDTSASSAIVKGMMCVNCWQATATGVGISISNNGGGTVSGIHFIGLRNYNNTGNGATINAGTNITFDSSTFCGNAAGQSNLFFASGVNQGAVRGSTVGGACDALTTTPAVGINFAGANLQFVVTGNDFTGVTTPVLGSPTGNSVMTGNIGLDPNTQSVASAASITLTNYPTVFVSGTTGITTINGGWNGRTVKLIATATTGVAYGTGGNICTNLASTQNVPVEAWYSGSCWYLK